MISGLPVDPDPGREEVRQGLIRYEATTPDRLDLLDQALVLDAGPLVTAHVLSTQFAGAAPRYRPDAPPPDPAGVTAVRAALRGDDPIASWNDVRVARYLAVKVALLAAPSAGPLASQIRELVPLDVRPDASWPAILHVLEATEQVLTRWGDTGADAAAPILAETRTRLEALRPFFSTVRERLPDVPDLPALSDLLPALPDIGSGLLVGLALLGGILWVATRAPDPPDREPDG